MDTKLHKIMLSKVLLSIYKNSFLSQKLGFKGGTATMFFYNLPRLSVDLDFDIMGNISSNIKKQISFELEKELKKHGEITDYADKKNTILYEIRYKNEQRRLKIEISKRGEAGKYIQKNFLGENISVMVEQDVFSNKMIALLNRKGITNRDIFDIWFFLSKGVSINEKIIEDFLGVSFVSYLDKIKFFIENYDFSKALYGLGEMLDPKQKKFVKTKMKAEILGYLEFYR